MYQTHFPPETFARRREALFTALPDDAVALVQGAPKEPAHDRFRQSNDFYYLCGVEVPHAYLLLDGRADAATLYLPHQSPQRRAQEGEALSADNPDTVRGLTGVDDVQGLEALSRALERVEVIYTPLRIGEGPGMSWDTVRRAQQEAIADPWDGRLDRMRTLVAHLRARCPGAEIRDLAPYIDALRLVKRGGEIDLVRMAGKLSAAGVVEAMRSTTPGVWEYQLDAVMRYVYLNNGARDAGYRAIIASGANIWYGHYNANNAQMTDGDLVLVDCAPDYAYYTSDIGRMWPVNGRYTDLQHMLYGFVVAYHKRLLALIEPDRTPAAIMAEAAEQMRVVCDNTEWPKAIYRQGAERMLAWQGHFSHPVGMAVHDVGRYREDTLKPGLVFALDPSLWIPEERLYYRVEDTLLITEAGYENLTADAPLALDQVEATVGKGGLVQRYPPLD